MWNSDFKSDISEVWLGPNSFLKISAIRVYLDFSYIKDINYSCGKSSEYREVGFFDFKYNLIYLIQSYD